MPATMAGMDDLKLTFLATVRVERGDVHRLGRTPFGSVVVGGIAQGRWDGPRLAADIISPGGDWATPGDDDLMALDVRQMLRTDDGALISVRYQGRCDRAAGTYTVAPTFETADERFGWLNRIQAVGRGVSQGNALVYQMYEIS